MIVTAIEQQKKDKSRYSIFVDGKFVFGLIGEDIAFFKLKEGCEISEETYDYISNTTLYIKAQDVALKYLGYKKRTKKEVVEKIKTYDYTDEIVDKVIEFLEKYNYINDLDYAQSYIRHMNKLNPKGKFELTRALKALGVTCETIEEAFLEEEIDETEMAVKLLEKKLKGETDLDIKEKKKIHDFLARRGFSYGIIKEAFAKCHIKFRTDRDFS